MRKIKKNQEGEAALCSPNILMPRNGNIIEATAMSTFDNYWPEKIF